MPAVLGGSGAGTGDVIAVLGGAGDGTREVPAGAGGGTAVLGAPVEPRDFLSERGNVEALELRGEITDAAAGGFLSDTHLGQLRAEPTDFGFESVHRAPTRAAAGEERQHGQHAEASAHPFRP